MPTTASDLLKELRAEQEVPTINAGDLLGQLRADAGMTSTREEADPLSVDIFEGAPGTTITSKPGEFLYETTKSAKGVLEFLTKQSEDIPKQVAKLPHAASPYTSEEEWTQANIDFAGQPAAQQVASTMLFTGADIGGGLSSFFASLPEKIAAPGKLAPEQQSGVGLINQMAQVIPGDSPGQRLLSQEFQGLADMITNAVVQADYVVQNAVMGRDPETIANAIDPNNPLSRAYQAITGQPLKERYRDIITEMYGGPSGLAFGLSMGMGGVKGVGRLAKPKKLTIAQQVAKGKGMPDKFATKMTVEEAVTGKRTPDVGPKTVKLPGMTEADAKLLGPKETKAKKLEAAKKEAVAAKDYEAAAGLQEKIETLQEKVPEPKKPTPKKPEQVKETKPTPEEVKKRYPLAKEVVDGRTVRRDIPNQESIDASIDNPTILSGIREVPMSDFEGITGKHYSVQGNKRIKRLAQEIADSKEITPLIVVIDKGGPYILEGATRVDALYRLGAKSFPAQIVLEQVKKAKPKEGKQAKKAWEMTKEEYGLRGIKAEIPGLTDTEARNLLRARDAEPIIKDVLRKRGIDVDRIDIPSSLAYDGVAEARRPTIMGRKPSHIESINLAVAEARDAVTHIKDMVLPEHLKDVRLALAEGKPVPESVLKDYPDLVKAKPATVNRKTIETALKSRRVRGDNLLNTLDLFDELAAKKAEIAPDGTVTLYHRTSKSGAKTIIRTGKMISKEDRLFFGTRPTGQIEGYGEAAVKVRLPIEKLELNDVFAEEAHVTMKSGRIGTAVPVKAELVTQPPSEPAVKAPAAAPVVKPAPPVKPLVKPKVAQKAPEGVRGLNVKENEALRAKINRKSLNEYQRKSQQETYQRAVNENVESRALEIADEAKKSKRMITDEESAGIVIKSIKLETEYEASIKLQSELVAKGDLEAAKIERGRSETIIKDLDRLTEGMRLGKREVARSLASGAMKVDPADYSLARAVQEATAKRGEKLKPEQQAQLEKAISERDNLQKQLTELEAEYEKSMAEREKIIAEKVAKIEARRAGIKGRIGKKKAQLQVEREGIKKQLRDMGFRVNDITGLSAEGSYLVGKLAVNYIHTGTLTLEGVVKQIIADMPNLTERDVWQALNARDPKAVRKARSKTQKIVAEIKTQGRLLDILADAEKGIFEKPTAKAKPILEIQRLRKAIRQLRVQAYKTAPTDVRLTKLIDTMNELQDQLSNHYRNVKKKRAPDPAVIAEVKEKLALLRKEMKMEDVLSDLKEQLRTGEFKNVKREPITLPENLDRLHVQVQIARKSVRAAVIEAKPTTVGKVAGEIVNSARTMQTMGEMSGMMRQGLVLVVQAAFTQPRVLPKNFAQAVVGTFSRMKAEKYDAAWRRMPGHYLREKAKVDWLDLEGSLKRGEELFAGRFLEKVPALGEVVQASKRNMTLFLNSMRASCFDYYVAKYSNATPHELRRWGNFVNIASGRGNLGGMERYSGRLSWPLYAPRYAVARIQYPWMGFREIKNPRVRKEIAYNYVRVASTGMMALGLAELAGWEVGLNPYESDWGKIKIGNTRYDIWGGLQQPMRVVVRLGYYLTDQAGWTGKELLDSEKRLDVLDFVGRAASYKLGPPVTLPLEILSGKSIVGEKAGPIDTSIRAFTPLMIQDILDAWKLERSNVAGVAGATFFGIGANTFEDSESRVRRDIRKLIREGKLLKAQQKRFSWNAENPDDQISRKWLNNQIFKKPEGYKKGR